MNPPRRPVVLAALLAGVAGCHQMPVKPASARVDASVAPARYESGVPVYDHRPTVMGPGAPADRADLDGVQPVDVFIRRALAENRTVQAAYHNVQSLKAPHPAGDGARRPGRLERGLSHPERRTPVFLDGIQPL